MKIKADSFNTKAVVFLFICILALPLFAQEPAPDNQDELFNMSLEELMEIEVASAPHELEIVPRTSWVNGILRNKV
ncbi:MAG: hypothetical protein ACYTE8_00820 [Planctomycetota bacterium]|jgi:hypothetical protein